MSTTVSSDNVARYGTSKQTAFNLPRNNLHFPVQRFRWEIYCEYACSTYEYEYEKIIMPTTARDAGSSHAETLSFLHLSFPVSLSLSPSFSHYLSFFSLGLAHSQNPREGEILREGIEKSSHRVIDGRNRIYANK